MLLTVRLLAHQRGNEHYQARGSQPTASKTFVKDVNAMTLQVRQLVHPATGAGVLEALASIIARSTGSGGGGHEQLADLTAQQRMHLRDFLMQVTSDLSVPPVVLWSVRDIRSPHLQALFQGIGNSIAP